MKMNQFYNTEKEDSGGKWMRGVGYGGCSSHDIAHQGDTEVSWQESLTWSGKESVQWGYSDCFGLQMKLLANRGFNWIQMVNPICRRRKTLLLFDDTYTQNKMRFCSNTQTEDYCFGGFGC